MNYKEKIERLKKSCYGNAPCEIDRERLEAAQIIEGLIRERDAAIYELHGKCSCCKNHSAYHRKGKCKNCMWDNANPACLREYQDDCWEWKGIEKEEQ